MKISQILNCIGRHVNMKLKDGSVIVNVRVERIIIERRTKDGKKVEISYNNKKELISLDCIADVVVINSVFL